MKTKILLILAIAYLVSASGCISDTQKPSATISTTTPTTTTPTTLKIKPATTLSAEIRPGEVEAITTTTISQTNPSKPTTTLRATPQKTCTTDSDCGLAPGDEIKCKSGDAHTYSQTPTCTDNGVCVTSIEYTLLKECDDREWCVDGTGCENKPVEN
ncbi:hypothetical protein ACFLRC_01065 [Candidatus Altiarchaeota archaeon]